MRKKSRGNLGENLALKYLQNKGYKFIDRNFRSRFGEIDLILKDKDILVFVEVKIRFSDEYGSSVESITPWKIRRLIKTVQFFKLRNPHLPDSLRIDVVAMDLNIATQKLLSIKHIKNITL